MTKMFKACFALTVLVVSYFVGYAGITTIHTQFFQPPPPAEQSFSMEELAEALNAERAATSHGETCKFPHGETCEQEMP
mgnify:CR=1 FL=1